MKMGLPLSNNSEPVSSEALHTDGSFRKAQRMSKTNHWFRLRVTPQTPPPDQGATREVRA